MTLLVGPGDAPLRWTKDFIYGFVEEGGERYYIEPLWIICLRRIGICSSCTPPKRRQPGILTRLVPWWNPKKPLTAFAKQRTAAR